MKARQRGLTLIELMISMVMTLFIAIALLTLLININRNNTELARTNSVIENGRFALQLLESDVSLAGFWGGYVPDFDDLTVSAIPTSNGTGTATTAVIIPTDVPDPCTSTAPASWTADYKAQLIAIPVQVYQVSSGGTPAVCASVITNAQPNTDILIVRHAAPCAASSTATDDDCKDTSGNLFFQYSRCATDAYTLMLSADAASLVLRTGACVTPVASPDPYIAPKYRFISTIYWVRNYFVAAGDGIPTLMRTRFQLSGGSLGHTGTDSLVDGVQAFRVSLGIDSVSKPTTSGGTGVALTSASFAATPTWAVTTNMYTPTNRGDGGADSYVTCVVSTTCYDASNLTATAFNLTNVVAVKLYVLVRATSKTPAYTDSKVYCLSGTETDCDTTVTAKQNLTWFGPFSDGYKRHVYTQTIRAVNISTRRETPNSW